MPDPNHSLAVFEPDYKDGHWVGKCTCLNRDEIGGLHALAQSVDPAQYL
jgi:hypothetical protein